jgi:hypothetical protein
VPASSVNTVVVMVEPAALADTVTPPILAPSGPATAPVRIEGPAAGTAAGRATYASNDKASAAVMRLATCELEDMACFSMF